MIFSVAAISVLAACYSLLDPGTEARRDFIVCLGDETVVADCKRPLRVSVAKDDVQRRWASNRISANDASFRLRLPKNEKMSPLLDEQSSFILVSFWLESFESRYARYAETGPVGSLSGYPMHRSEGSLIAISETASGETGTEFLTPANGDKSIFIRCIKQYRAIAGNLVTNPGCEVYTQIQPFVFIHYSIQRKHLQDWKSINKDVLNKAQAAMKIS